MILVAWNIDNKTLFMIIAGAIIVAVLIWVGITSLIKKNKKKKEENAPKPFAEAAKAEEPAANEATEASEEKPAEDEAYFGLL